MGSPTQMTPFQDAVTKWISNLSPKKKKHGFVAFIISLDNHATAETVQEAVMQLERSSEDKASSKIMIKVLQPIITVLKDYYGVVDVLSNADPMPTAIIWGALKIVIDGCARFMGIYDTIKNELRGLKTQIERLTDYEDLYGDSTAMQGELSNSYINLLRFWHQINKECNRCTYPLTEISAISRATASFGTKKLQDILNDMQRDATNIERLAPIINARRQRHEREDADLERREAALERAAIKQERVEAFTWRQKQQDSIPGLRFREISTWLGAHLVTERNKRHHRDIIDARFDNTCDWLLELSLYKDWHSGQSADSIIWLSGGPGIGKSTLCSRAVEQQKHCGIPVAVHYCRFDEQITALQTVQSLSDQLLDYYWLRYKDIPERLYTCSQRSASDLENAQSFIELLVEEFVRRLESSVGTSESKQPSASRIYLFIDGLDGLAEERDMSALKEAKKVFNSLTKLVTAFPKNLRLWFSTRDESATRAYFEKHPQVDLQNHVEEDVAKYIGNSVLRIIDDLAFGDDVHEDEDEVRAYLFGELQRRAKDNFLFATLMIKRLQHEVGSFDEIIEFVQNGIPEDLEHEYKRIFERYSKFKLKYVTQVFSFVAFAKVPLRLEEIEELICMNSSANSTTIDRTKRLVRLPQLFAPLIEVREYCYEKHSSISKDLTCHLFHSSVKDFLIQNPRVVQDREDVKEDQCLLITNDAISKACISYLSQDRFAALLRKAALEDGTKSWITASGESINDHKLLTYAAKYWDKRE
ncbi:MAG: hypothetical protein M1820_000921 [Bogoriella megaspora]|nr:MAG: hypothetical protein M1820_000921 [Bogoriella megaspora]